MTRTEPQPVDLLINRVLNNSRERVEEELSSAVEFGAHKAGPRCENTRPHGTEGDSSMQRKRRGPKPRPVGERFWEKVDKDGAGGCWLWTAGLTWDGYGVFCLRHGTMVPAHRFAYELLVGSIPEGLELDHVREWGCRHRHCVNPAHLEPVTGRENTMRSLVAPSAVNARKTHCPVGHPLAGGNLRISPRGYRICRACERDRSARRREAAQIASLRSRRDVVA